MSGFRPAIDSAPAEPIDWPPTTGAPVTALADFVISVVGGPDGLHAIEIGGGWTPRALVGRSPVCALRLTDPGVARRHLSLEAGAGGLRLIDLGSPSGTYVNGVRTGEAILAGEEVIRIGDTLLAVDRRADAPARPLPTETRFGRVLGASVAMRRIYRTCESLALGDVPALIEGETGTGKELLAESIHELGPRAEAPFVVLDCAAAPPERIRAALLGDGAGRGAFAAAAFGTLFLDEITALDLDAQDALLDRLDRSPASAGPVGVRVIAASRRDVDERVERGLFRGELFHRLAAGRVELPPLRERHGDVELLAGAFWWELTREDHLPGELARSLDGYRWPGNVRELLDVVTLRAAAADPSPPDPAAADLDRLLALDLPLPQARRILVDSLERRYAERVLARAGGDLQAASRAWGVPRRAFVAGSGA